MVADVASGHEVTDTVISRILKRENVVIIGSEDNLLAFIPNHRAKLVLTIKTTILLPSENLNLLRRVGRSLNMLRFNNPLGS